MLPTPIQTTVQDYVQQFEMADFLNPALLERLKLFQFPVYSYICEEGAEQHYLYFLVDGQVQCSHYHLNGKLAVIALSEPFTAIGDLEILTEQYLRSNVIATRATTMLAIEKEIVQQYGADDPIFLRFLLDQYRVKIYQSNTLQMNQVLPLINRLALYILAQDAEHTESVILPSKEELASLMGTTTRHLNRILRQLVNTNAISQSYPLVKILNQANLEQLATS